MAVFYLMVNCSCWSGHRCSEMLSLGKSCKMGIGPSGWRKKNCLITSLMLLMTVFQQFVFWLPVNGMVNKDSAEGQIQQKIHSPETTGMVVERSSVTSVL